ncbi:CPBP family intramembrane glutamic endopeptidase [Pseudidiomarina homiensis]|uniref:CPBP family intramembrane metalloprotease n=1 Tax=Pseudidiomarina homiensis TaxID=364198 RepID=A0A432Y4V0_9GAMM|nr:type II CAAX endopeptidase family protein [Pseudidiomarina homiensis]RUO55926.1 CPBP family intramembrane metalloprotease [Pseudidiomarina homiensis]
MTIQPTEWLMLFIIVLMPVYSLWEADKVKIAILAGRKTKIRAYQDAMLFMWLPTLVLLALMAYGAFAPSDFSLLWLGNLGNWIGTVFVVAIAGYFAYSAYTLMHNASARQKFRDVSQNHDWMMPVNKSELRWFTLGLSVSAGVCEELLFRGFIIGALGDSLGVVVSLILSSLLFGLCHVYQGWMNVLRTGIIGLVLGVIFILTESLWVVIALHALVDIYGGIVGYLFQQPEK